MKHDSNKNRTELLDDLDTARAQFAGQSLEVKCLERHLHLFEHSERALFQSTPDGRLLVINNAYARLFGYDSPEQALSGIGVVNGTTYVGPYRREEVLRMILDAQGVREFENEYRRRDGSTFLAAVRACAVRDGVGVVEYIEGSLEDITERKRTEEALRESQQMLEHVIDTIPVRVFWKDRDSVYLGCNRLFALDGGMASPAEVIGKNDYDLTWTDRADLYRQDDREVMESGIPKLNYEERQTTPAGGQNWLRTSKIPLRDKEDRIVGMLGTYEDITDSKRAEQERGKLEAQIQQAQKLESLGVLAGGIAHDFNNLLMGVLGHASLALMELSPVSPARDSLQQIETAAIRAAELCKQMLAYSGKGRFVVQPLNLNELVEEMAHLLQVSISKKVVLKYHFAPNLPHIDADATQMRQIIMNLITNASDAIGDLSGVVTISTGAMECDSAYLAKSYLNDNRPPGLYVYLEVADTGSGMDASTLGRIFDPFFSTKFAGRGLGLSAVLGIVRGHKGAIRVYSEPRRGSTFKVLFPCSETMSLPAAAEKFDIRNVHGHGTILIVDDEETIRAVGKSMLEKVGFKVLTACDGREGVEVFAQHADEICAVLLDMTMPHLNGEEAFREMRRIRADVRVILSSGYNEVDATGRFAGKGLAGFIQKPYPIEALVSKLATILDLLGA